MSHIFLSYSHADDKDQFIPELEALLEQAGVDTWTDHDLKAGKNWRTEIDEAIQEAFALIVLMSPNAKASEFVTYEWSYAMGLGVPVLPILLRPTELHPKLDELQFLDFTEDITEPLAALMERLNELERDYLLKALKHTKRQYRLQAIKRIGQLKLAEAVPQLIRIMQQDSSKIVRPAAAEALIAIGTPEALQAVGK